MVGRPYNRNNFLDNLIAGNYVVTSTIFGCDEGYSKIVVRRRKRESEIPINMHFPIPYEYSGCRPNEEIEKIKMEIKKEVEKRKKRD